MTGWGLTAYMYVQLLHVSCSRLGSRYLLCRVSELLDCAARVLSG